MTKKAKGRHPRSGPDRLVLLLARFLTTALPSQSFFCPLLFARLQVVGVPLDLLDNIFLLYLAFETAESVL